MRPVRAAVRPDQPHADHVAADNADRVEDHREDRKRNHRGGEPRRDHALHRVNAHHLHGGKLLAGPHETDLRGERRAGTSGKKKRCHHGAELADQRERDENAERLFAAVSDENVIALKPQHRADEETRHRDNEQRVVPEEHHLLHDNRETLQARRELPDHLPGEAPEAPRVDNLIQDPGAHRADLLCQPIHRVTPRSSARGGAG